MVRKNKKAPKGKSKGGVLGNITKTAGTYLSGKAKGGLGTRRTRSVQWWANRVLKAKLKKKYYKIQYGGI